MHSKFSGWKEGQTAIKPKLIRSSLIVFGTIHLWAFDAAKSHLFLWCRVCACPCWLRLGIWRARQLVFAVQICAHTRWSTRSVSQALSACMGHFVVYDCYVRLFRGRAAMWKWWSIELSLGWRQTCQNKIIVAQWMDKQRKSRTKSEVPSCSNKLLSTEELLIWCEILKFMKLFWQAFAFCLVCKVLRQPKLWRS